MLGTSEPIGLSWTTVLAFLRITTDRRVFAQPATTATAAAVMSRWLDASNVTVLNPRARHWEVLRSLLDSLAITGPMTMDADLAALCIEHSATLYTADR